MLRENGYNTECSCGHKMYVQCQNIPDGGLQRLHELLYNNDYRNYEIDMHLECIDGCWTATTNIKISKKKKEGDK